MVVSCGDMPACTYAGEVLSVAGLCSVSGYAGTAAGLYDALGQAITDSIT